MLRMRERNLLGTWEGILVWRRERDYLSRSSPTGVVEWRAWGGGGVATLPPAVGHESPSRKPASNLRTKEDDAFSSESLQNWEVPCKQYCELKQHDYLCTRPEAN